MVVCESSVSDFDGNTYPVVKIGNQCWMAENLRVTHYADGTQIPKGDRTTNLSYNSNARAYFDHPEAPYSEDLNAYLQNKSKLYTWGGATNRQAFVLGEGDVQGACPNGWHIPSKAEWDELINFVGSTTAGRDLKSNNPNFWDINSPDNRGKDPYGFGAVSSGGRLSSTSAYVTELYTFFWTSSVQINEPMEVLVPSFLTYTNTVEWETDDKSRGYCVRCVKDNP